MTVNWWTLGLQAINVLILVWLLSWVFWRPVAKAIATRQTTAQALLDDAESAQSKADAALAEVNKTRAEMASERDALLAEAAAKAEAATKAALAAATEKAEALLKTARQDREREAETLRAKTAADAAELAVEIARKLLAPLGTGKVDTTFLDLLVEAVDRMPSDDKETLLKTDGGIDLVSARELDDATKTQAATAIGTALGGQPRLNFLSDPDLIAGFEIRTAHFILRNSWQSDLSVILKDLKNAA